ncbi:MAG: T9SS type A sorting domain-containing protein [Salinivirgaceae bacterium]
MKIKYFILFTISLLWVNSSIFGQTFCNTTDWNWLDLSQTNWKYYDDYMVPRDLRNPFSGDQLNKLDLSNIAKGEDYTQDEGWVLLDKEFGCINGTKYPYFILYNKYRGIIRLYIYGIDRPLAAQEALVSLTWNQSGAGKNALLSGLNNSFLYPNDKYQAFNQSTVEKSIFRVSPYYENYWYVADFNVTFDLSTDPLISLKELAFDISLVETSDVSLNGTFQFTTYPLTSVNVKGNQTSNNPTPVNNDYKDYLLQGKNYVEKIPDIKEMTKITEKASSDLYKYSQTVCTNFGSTPAGENFSDAIFDLSNDLNTGGNLSKFLLGVSNVGGVVGTGLKVAVGLIDLFSGKSKNTTSGAMLQPTISSGTISLAGQIRTSKPFRPILLELPGSNHVLPDNTPIYDCPLGVVTLEQEPALKIRKWTETSIKFYNFVPGHFNLPNPIGDYKYCEYDANGITENWKSIKLEDGIKIAINGAAEVELISCKFALVGKIRENLTNKPAYYFEAEIAPPALTSDFTYLDEFIIGRFPNFNVGDRGNSLNDDNPWTNKTLRYLNDNIYSLSIIDSAGFAEFSTPLMDVEQFKNTSMTVREETDLFIKVMCVFKPKNNTNSSPIIIWQKFKLTNDTENDFTTNVPYPFTMAQLVDIKPVDNSNLLSPENKLTKFTITNIPVGTYTNWIFETEGTIASNSNVALNAYHSVHLRPGFSYKSNGATTFNAKTVNNSGIIANNYTALNQIAQEVPVTCGSNKSAFINSEGTEPEALEIIEMSTKVFPNPVFETLNVAVTYENEEPATIEVYNQIGQKVYQNTTQDTQFTVDFGNLNSGLYLVRIEQNKKIQLHKVIKK